MTPKLYEGTKRLHAQPMTRGEYNAYRGWENPADENPADEGYLVEYLDGGKSNHPNHAGYISWSPKDVFERSYKELPASLPAAAATQGDDAIEAEIQAKGLTAPRVTPADIESNIVHTEIVKHIAPSGQVLRWAVLTTRNGFAVTGKPSASVSPANDDAEVGENVAIENARSELWPLMGYELRSKLATDQKEA